MPKSTKKEEISASGVGETVVTSGTVEEVTLKTVSKGPTLTAFFTKKESTTKGASTDASRRKTSVIEKKGSSSSSSKVSDAVTAAILQSKLDTLEKDTMGESWHAVLLPEIKKTYFSDLKKFLLNELCLHAIYPSVENIYSWSRLTPLDQVKVVILGQDPYHDVGQAHGLSFSVLPPTKPPPSLKNIYKQLETDIPGFKTPKDGDLSLVAKQGVLWLNTSLTVRAHQAASHSRKGWETFTAQVVRAVLERKDKPGVVLMAWGLPAQKTFSSIGVDEKKHFLLKSAHPSPLSAHRGFLGNGHFKKANEWLTEKYGKEAAIDWTVLHK